MRYIKISFIIFTLSIIFSFTGCGSTYGSHTIGVQAAIVPEAVHNDYSSITSQVSADGYIPGDLPIKPSIKLLKGTQSSEKVAFLTIDDGPSIITSGFLDVLKANNVHATFCVIGNRAESYPEIIKRAYDEGNSIISHSYTHIFSEIYKSPGSFLESIEKSNKAIDSIIKREDIERSFLRFPGGALNSYAPIAEVLKSRGYNTLDWNVYSGDCDTGKATAEYIKGKGCQDMGESAVVVLMHDFKYRQTTLKALPDIIKHYKDKGYSFKTIRDMSYYELRILKDKRIVNILYK